MFWQAADTGARHVELQNAAWLEAAACLLRACVHCLGFGLTLAELQLDYSLRTAFVYVQVGVDLDQNTGNRNG
jgi:hypothetical protein